jgi:hypothetical protein
MNWGRNQIIAIGAGVTTLAMTFALVLTGRVSGPEWVTFVPWWLAAFLGPTLGGSAIVKATAKTQDPQA